MQLPIRMNKKRDAYIAKYEAKGWKYEQCCVCYGTGQVSSYSWGDFEGPKECDCCRGNGSIWITPKGRRVVYPGGAFC